MVYWIYLILAILLIIALFLLPWIAGKLLFFPDRFVSSLLLENEIITSNGISALFYDKGDNTPIIIHSHGNAGNVSHRQYLVNLLKDIPVSLLLYDYRGFGRSSGNTTTNSIIEDGENIYHHIITTYSNRKIIIWGESMGSAVAWNLASKYNVMGLIITAGYASLADVINNVTVPGLGNLISYLMFLPDNTIVVPHVTCPVILFHSEDDDLIPISHAFKIKDLIHNANKTNISLIQTRGGHNFNITDYRQEITRYIRSLVMAG